MNRLRRFNDDGQIMIDPETGLPINPPSTAGNGTQYYVPYTQGDFNGSVYDHGLEAVPEHYVPSQDYPYERVDPGMVTEGVVPMEGEFSNYDGLINAPFAQEIEGSGEMMPPTDEINFDEDIEGDYVDDKNRRFDENKLEDKKPSKYDSKRYREDAKQNGISLRNIRKKERQINKKLKQEGDVYERLKNQPRNIGEGGELIESYFDPETGEGVRIYNELDIKENPDYKIAREVANVPKHVFNKYLYQNSRGHWYFDHISAGEDLTTNKTKGEGKILDRKDYENVTALAKSLKAKHMSREDFVTGEYANTEQIFSAVKDGDYLAAAGNAVVAALNIGGNVIGGQGSAMTGVVRTVGKNPNTTPLKQAVKLYLSGKKLPKKVNKAVKEYYNKIPEALKIAEQKGFEVGKFLKEGVVSNGRMTGKVAFRANPVSNNYAKLYNQIYDNMPSGIYANGVTPVGPSRYSGAGIFSENTLRALHSAVASANRAGIKGNKQRLFENAWNAHRDAYRAVYGGTQLMNALRIPQVKMYEPGTVPDRNIDTTQGGRYVIPRRQLFQGNGNGGTFGGGGASGSWGE